MTEGKIERVSTKSLGDMVVGGRYHPAHGEQLLFKGQRIYAIEAYGCNVCCVNSSAASCSIPEQSGINCTSRQFVDELTWIKMQVRGEL